MAQFPTFLTPQTPEGLVPHPTQIHPLNLAPLINALEKSKATTAAAKGKAAKDSDSEVKGLVGGVKQYYDNIEDAQGQMKSMMSLYGPTVAATLPAFQQAQETLDYVSSDKFINTLRRQELKFTEYNKNVGDAKAGGLYHLEAIAETQGKETKKNQDYIKELEYGKTSSLPGATADGKTSYLNGYNGTGHYDDFNYAPNFFTAKDALEHANTILDPVSGDKALIEEAFATTAAGQRGDIKGIVARSGNDANNRQGLYGRDLEKAKIYGAIDQLYTEAGLGHDEDGNLTWNPFDNLSNPLVAGSLQDFLGKSNGGKEYNGKKLRNEDGTFNEDFYREGAKHTESLLRSNTDKRQKVTKDRSESFDQLSDYWAGAGAATDEIKEMFQAQKSATQSIAQNVFFGANGVELSKDPKLQADLYGAFNSLMEGTGLYSLTPAMKEGFDKMDPAKRAEAIANIANEYMVANDVFTKEETTDENGNVVAGYKIKPGAEKTMTKVLNDLEAKRKAGTIDDDNYERVKNGLQTLASTVFKHEAEGRGAWGLTAQVTEKRILPFTPTFQKALEDAWVGRPVNEVAYNTQVSINGGLSFVSGSGFKHATVSSIAPSAEIAPGGAATNWNSKFGTFTDETGNGTTVIATQADPSNGYMFMPMSESENKSRFDLARTAGNNAQALFTNPHNLNAKTRFEWDSEDKRKEDLAKLNVAEPVEIPQYSKTKQEEYKNIGNSLVEKISSYETSYVGGRINKDAMKANGFTPQEIAKAESLTRKSYSDGLSYAINMSIQKKEGSKAPNTRVALGVRPAYDKETGEYANSVNTGGSLSQSKRKDAKGNETTVYTLEGLTDAKGYLGNKMTSTTVGGHKISGTEPLQEMVNGFNEATQAITPTQYNPGNTHYTDQQKAKAEQAGKVLLPYSRPRQ